ncbi:sugar ABC transporter permease [Paenibacillus tyrfis]|uniref:ABC transporter permease n=1 Tax=Paenibacillus TaxID=44249 RepID=UPI001C1FD89D|nr:MULTISPECIES: ABC transporter permease subunit [Paenibacillus]MBU7316596.1 ABC transporter permease subunit [Paenibacillus oleatilyticus]GLI09818.1 sugar ABC transporter permease [Paenibacillus tyrfis]
MKTAKWRRELPLHILVFPSLIIVLIYCYIPMYGNIIAFQNFKPTQGFWGSEWTGLANLNYVLEMPNTFRIIWNTVYIATMKIIMGNVVPILIALLLNEVRLTIVKRSVQTLIYFPYFLSWVILAGILIDVLSLQDGIVNQALGWLGMQPIYFLGDNRWFPITLVLTDTWKEFGFGTIVYLAALTSINPSLYEAAIIDGANRWKQTLHITLPGMVPIIILMATLSLGNVLNAGFDQVFNLYSPQVYESGDILDTLIYRIGVSDAQYGPATAIGLLKSSVSFILISVSYWLAYRFANYRIF